MVDGKECVEVIKELKQLSEDEIKELLSRSTGEIFLDMLSVLFPTVKGIKALFQKVENKTYLLSFILELKKNEKLLDKLSKEIVEKEERIKFLEEKQSNIDEIVQEKISKQLKKYEEKIRQLEKENKELKEQLGYYG